MRIVVFLLVCVTFVFALALAFAFAWITGFIDGIERAQDIFDDCFENVAKDLKNGQGDTEQD